MPTSHPFGGLLVPITAMGTSALVTNTIGGANTANGAFALRFNTGDFNTASGQSALISNTTGSYNTASGLSALRGNITGSSNTDTGAYALRSNATGTRLCLTFSLGSRWRIALRHCCRAMPLLSRALRLGEFRYCSPLAVTSPPNVGVLNLLPCEAFTRFASLPVTLSDFQMGGRV